MWVVRVESRFELVVVREIIKCEKTEKINSDEWGNPKQFTVLYLIIKYTQTYKNIKTMNIELTYSQKGTLRHTHTRTLYKTIFKHKRIKNTMGQICNKIKREK